MLLAIERMEARYKAERDDSDIAAFYSLLYFGELITKLLVLGFMAGILDDRDRHRYAILFDLVRADGIGDWDGALSRSLTGPASQVLHQDFRDLQREVTQRQPSGTWQYEAVERLIRCREH